MSKPIPAEHARVQTRQERTDNLTHARTHRGAQYVAYYAIIARPLPASDALKRQEEHDTGK